jgi:hypothetical protein
MTVSLPAPVTKQGVGVTHSNASNKTSKDVTVLSPDQGPESSWRTSIAATSPRSGFSLLPDSSLSKRRKPICSR